MTCAPDKSARPHSVAAAWLAWPETRQVFAALAEHGHETRAVGGAVRNTLFGQEVSDIDLATTARPEQVTALAERAGLKAVPTGLDHGTVTVVVGHRPYEVTTLRTDVETFGRHARVAFTDDWAADAERRDFTMNALYLAADGVLHDPLGGYADIAARRVRFIGDAAARIREDYLRILRFFRFNAVYGMRPFDPDGLAACVRERAGLAALSPERVHGELARLLVAPGAGEALESMYDHGLLVDVLGGVVHLGRFARLAVIERELDVAPSAMRRLAALDVMVAEDVERFRTRFRLSNVERRSLACTLASRELSNPQHRAAAKRLIYRSDPFCFREALLLAWALSGTAPNAAAWRELYELPERWPVPEFPLAGADVRGLGVPEGPEVGEVLRLVEEDWIAGGFEGDKDALLARARGVLEHRV